jgi:hypothetical protein
MSEISPPETRLEPAMSAVTDAIEQGRKAESDDAGAMLGVEHVPTQTDVIQTDSASKGETVSVSKGETDSGSKGETDSGSKGETDSGSNCETDSGAKGETDTGSKRETDCDKIDSAESLAKSSCGKPKQPSCAYWIYQMSIREEVSKRNAEKNGGKSKFGEVAKEVSSLWKMLSDSERKVFEDKAAADKLRYAAEMKVYLESHSKTEDSGTPKMKRTRTSTPSSGKKPAKVPRNDSIKSSVDPKMLAEASRLGMEASLENLAGRPEVIAGGYTTRALLDALKASKGLVNPAKRALLGV